MAQDAEDTYLSPAEAARLLLVSPVTLRAWAQKGLLPSETTPGGHRRFLRRDVEQFMHCRRGQRQGQNSHLRLLIVDDEEQVAGCLFELLREMSQSLMVETAQDGFEAGSKLLSFAPDMVLLDLMMPGMNGFDVCHRIKSNPATADIRVIAMTGYPSEENVRNILAAGAEFCLSKPIDVDKLEQILFG